MHIMLSVQLTSRSLGCCLHIATHCSFLRASSDRCRACRTSVVKVAPSSAVADGSKARQRVQGRIVDELRAGGSVFWVFPLVHESEHFANMGSATEVHYPMALLRLLPDKQRTGCLRCICVRCCFPHTLVKRASALQLVIGHWHL